MASSGSSKRKVSRNRKSTENRASATAGSSVSLIRSEVLIWASLAFCILLLIGNFGLGGSFGHALSSVFFGLTGVTAYLMPFIILFIVAFSAANAGNVIAYVKTGACVFLLFMICTFLQLMSASFNAAYSPADYFRASAQSHRGGGLFGGLFCMLFHPAFGLVGSYVVVIILSLICIVLITEKSLLKGIRHGGSQMYNNAKSNAEKHREERSRRRDEREESAHEAPFLKDSDSLTAPADSIKPAPKVPIYPSFRTEEPVEPEAPVINDPVTPPIKEQHRKKKSSSATGQESHELDKEIALAEKSVLSDYSFPPMHLLKNGKGQSAGMTSQQLNETAHKLQKTLSDFGVEARVVNAACGPTVTRYELAPEQGVKVSRILNLADDIKLNLAARDIRIEAPIPGKAAVGIEVPNAVNTTVTLRELLESEEFQNHKSNIAFAVGRDIAGHVVIADIAKMPHLLIGGATGSGKSVCINTLIISILYKSRPEDVRMIMIDPKMIELNLYNGIPHLLIPVVTDSKKAAGALHWAVAEMTRRYKLFAELSVRDLSTYNSRIKTAEVPEGHEPYEKMPQIVIIVDEFADLMMVASGEVEDSVCRLAQLARAAGIHLILATQRPSVDVITGLIKANMPSRIALAVSSGVDSRTIIDMVGAEKLLGKGDMLFYPAGYPKPVRIQGAFVSEEEVENVVEYIIRKNGDASYDEGVANHVDSAAAGGNDTAFQDSDEHDAYFEDAGRFIIDKDKASIGMLQRVFKIGFNRAARIMDQLADAGVVGEEEGTKPRKILMTQEQFEAYLNNDDADS